MAYTFHYLLMANQAAFQKKVLSRCQKTNLTAGQPKVLDYLKDFDGATQKDIAKGCHIEPASLSSILSRMEEKEIVERKMLNGNRRNTYVFLTPLGKELQHSVEEAFKELESCAFAGVSEEDKETFMKVFLKVYDNIKER